jgi:hypothetical protein
MTPEEARALVAPLSAGSLVRRGVLLPTGKDGKQTMIYSVWEPLTGGILNSSHSTMMRIGERWYGALHTRRLPASLDSLEPYSQERSNAVRAFHDALEEMMFSVILHVYPHLVETGNPSYGDMWETVSMSSTDALAFRGETVTV